MENPVVIIKQGQLRGTTGIDYDGNLYYSFQGIPYAKPPVENLRFRAPQPPEPWKGIFDATKDDNACIQRDRQTNKIKGSEDCLFIKVFTPKLPTGSDNLKPVMVWIHGGAFIVGSSESILYGPEFLLTQDVVVVSFNYRLGALGFLSMEDTSLDVPGNAAFKDMVLALKWVQKNIKVFNGDPNNVTIFGESAGAAAVHYLYLSPTTKGLFHKAIIQSGSALNLWAYGTRCAKELAQAMGSKATTEKDILDFLTTAPAEKLFEGQESLKDLMVSNQIRPFGPVIEKVTKEPAFITEMPIDIIKAGKYNMLPFFAGFTTRVEGMLFARDNGEHAKDLETAVPWVLQIKPGSETSKQIASKVKDYYYDNEEPGPTNVEKTYLLDTDAYFLRGVHSSVKYHAVNSTTPIYFYRMSLEAGLNFAKHSANITSPGVAHGDDLGYLFKSYYTPKIKPGSIEDISVRRFVKLWATFARYGNPNPPEPDPLIKIEWKPVKVGQLNYLDIGENLTVGIDPEFQRIDFWDEIYNTKPNTA